MRVTFLIIRKDVGILNDKFSLPQCSSSSSQSGAYQVELGRDSGSVFVGPRFQAVYDEFMWNERICAQYCTQMERDTGSASGSF